ncbi:hypothetical protein PGT21_028802 [Puccinia graminis f. sp. tritici]|uniref:Uncharacterized protein n=1 Tax=Puccinia graminis f. sp. tritici TaxID=56615 RepID=A0A5B0RLX3_PUCGR|nr:hypothetical protein PGT21_028802 [Puccinia graminis f. sp. tritici]KAA1126617.1 hypothetical protein PGTUg99_030383 [Puccinia graminis f. sp. tritici]
MTLKNDADKSRQTWPVGTPRLYLRSLSAMMQLDDEVICTGDDGNESSSPNDVILSRILAESFTLHHVLVSGYLNFFDVLSARHDFLVLVCLEAFRLFI